MDMTIVALLLLVMGLGSYADYKIQEIWGRPVSFVSSDNYTVHTAENNTVCMTICYQSLYCVLSHFENGTCHNYDFNTVLTVQKLNSSSLSLVGVKVNVTDLGDVCPSTFEDVFPMNLSIYDPDRPLMEFSYSISYEPFVFTFVYNETRLCPYGFTKFVRPKGEYCLYVYASLGTMFTYDQATTLCGTYQGVLSGLETDEERVFVTDQGRINNLNDTFGGNMYWVSGYRKTSCSTVEQVAQPACAGINAFSQTDQYLTNLTGYQWTANNPDGVTANGTIQSCIIIWTEKVPGTLNGLVDDMTCTANQTGYAAVRGFVCGRVAGV